MMSFNESMIARVGVLGYGTIGRRLATAVTKQPDMHFSGVAGRPDSVALARARAHGFRTIDVDDANLTSSPTEFDDFLASIDVLLDCTPSGTPELYRRRLDHFPDLVSIVQGGEKAESCDVSFNSITNFADAIGRQRIRIVSCSSTGMTRLLWAIKQTASIEDAFVTLARRGADPGKLSKVPTNSIVPTLGESHHARDVQTVLPDVRLFSVSVNCPTTRSHVIWFHIDLGDDVAHSQILKGLQTTPRIIVGTGVQGTDDVADHFADLGRFRHDHPELFVFGETVKLQGRTLSLAICVHMESITIPETIDCIRAALGLETDPWRSIRVTDASLGIARTYDQSRLDDKTSQATSIN